jgi:two-component system sensor histidine kinase KdpD
MPFAELAAFAIHEVKNRLALLASRAERAGDAETLRDALESAATLTQLLAYFRAERGELGIQIDACTPADLLEELIADLGRQSAVRLRAELGASPPLWFYDQTLVRMVLLNAVYNALRHAHSEICLAARVREGWLEFSVRDDGPGYPAGLLGEPLAMQPLSRSGTGLGLHLAGRVAAMHVHSGQAGCIVLDNDGGAVFTLRLPP